MEKIIVGIIVGIGIIAIAVLFSLLMAYPVYLLWNGCLVGAITGIQAITWKQAWGITVLFNILFKPTINSGSKG